MTKKELTALKEVYGHLTMRRCGFIDEPWRGDTKADAAFTEKIMEATRLWRDTWILPQLAEIIQKYDPRWKPEPLQANEPCCTNRPVKKETR